MTATGMWIAATPTAHVMQLPLLRLNLLLTLWGMMTLTACQMGRMYARIHRAAAVTRQAAVMTRAALIRAAWAFRAWAARQMTRVCATACVRSKKWSQRLFLISSNKGC